MCGSGSGRGAVSRMVLSVEAVQPDTASRHTPALACACDAGSSMYKQRGEERLQAWQAAENPGLYMTRTCSLMRWVAPAGAQPHIKATVPRCKRLAACDAARHPRQAGVQDTCTHTQASRRHQDTWPLQLCALASLFWKEFLGQGQLVLGKLLQCLLTASKANAGHC